MAISSGSVAMVSIGSHNILKRPVQLEKERSKSLEDILSYEDFNFESLSNLSASELETPCSTALVWICCERV